MSPIDALINGVLIVSLIGLTATAFYFGDKPNQQGIVVLGILGLVLVILLYIAAWQHQIRNSQHRIEKLLHTLFGGEGDVRIGLEGSVQYLRNRIAEYWQNTRHLITKNEETHSENEETHGNDDTS